MSIVVKQSIIQVCYISVSRVNITGQTLYFTPFLSLFVYFCMVYLAAFDGVRFNSTFGSLLAQVYSVVSHERCSLIIGTRDRAVNIDWLENAVMSVK